MERTGAERQAKVTILEEEKQSRNVRSFRKAFGLLAHEDI